MYCFEGGKSCFVVLGEDKQSSTPPSLTTTNNRVFLLITIVTFKKASLKETVIIED